MTKEDTKKDKKDTKETKKEDGKKDGDIKEEMSEEDKQLQEELNMLVERLQEPKKELYKPALEQIRSLIRSSTTSMTSVPKPLKFMREHYQTMKDIYEKMEDPSNKKFTADIVSVLAMTMSEERECLKFRLNGNRGDIGDWGHEYVRHLAGEIAQEWELAGEEDKDRRKDLITEARVIVPYHMQHNAEAEACDLLMEMEQLDLITSEDYVDADAYQRVCLYLTSCVPYVPDPENTNLLKTSLNLYRKFKQYPQAMRLALQLHDHELIKELFDECPDKLVKMQVAFMLGRHQVFLELPEEMDDYEDFTEILSNSHLNTHFLSLGRELDIMDPKTPEDIYKSHLENRPAFGPGQVDSARQNLASSFVNGFVNAAFGTDKLLTEDGNKWLYKNKEHGMMSATASLGLILLWDVDGGLTQIDKYLYASEDFIKAGALLACGIVNSGVRNECDPALALLSDYIGHKIMVIRIGAILGLGLAYAGSNREAVLKVLTPVLTEEKVSMEVVGMTALACGMISVGTTNQLVVEALVTCLLARSETELKDTYARFIALGLALTYLGCQDKCEVVLSCIESLAAPFRQMTGTLIEVCAYAGSGNVLKVQEMLHICTDHYDPEESKSKEKEKKDKEKEKEKEKEKDKDKDKEKEKDKDKDSKEKKEEEKEVDLSSQQAVAVLGIALISMGEDIGGEMSFRQFGNLLRYCEPVIRRAVPLALGLISVSNPRLNILDTLSKFSHDADSDVAHNAIFAMGLVGAGTNNARLAAMLRQLAQYHAKDPNNLFMVRLAQGLCHLGKGTMTLSPYHSDRSLMSPVAVAGLLSTCLAFLDTKTLILGKSHYLLYCLTTAIQPRMLVTFDEQLNPLPVSVRVGQSVDVVGQAGKPKTITGFQTHTTPVLLAHGERAELATDEYLPVTPIMEGFVILKKNPDFES